MEPRTAVLRAAILLALASPVLAGPAPEPEASRSSCPDFPDDEDLEQKFMLLQSNMEISSGGESSQGDVYDYIQQLIDERAAAEAMRMVEKGDIEVAPIGSPYEIQLSHNDGRHLVFGSSSNATAETAAEMSGVSQNGEGDLEVLFHGLLTNGIIIGACLLIFSFGKIISPMVYAFRDVDGKSDGFFGWIRASYRLTLDDIQLAAGLDYAMLIEFGYMALKLLLVVGLPFLAILSPLDWCCGGNAAGKDHLSWIGMANVQPGSWVCWVHAPAVWWTIGATQYLIFRTMNKTFMPRRTRWLMHQPRLRATTVMVENIPEGKNTVEGMTSYFNDFVFGRQVVREVQIVKDVSDLVPLIQEREKLEAGLHKLRDDPNEAQNVARLRQVEDEIGRLSGQVSGDDQLNTQNGFVTFYHRREAVISMKLLSPDDEEDVEVTMAPEIEDVLWDDLLKDPTTKSTRELIGYLLIVALFFTFLPMVVGISAITDLNNLSDWFPIVKKIVAKYPAFSSFWESFVGAAALSIVMGFVPLFLGFISSKFFILRARSMVQNYLQIFVYNFSVVFVLLVTAVGSSLLTTSEQLLRSPMSVFSLLAETMPLSTHFYMNYFAVQWSTHFMNLTRYQNAAKFAFFSRIYEPLEAKEHAEPEDETDYGIGSRSARWSLLLVAALVFGTLSPIMTVFGLINFLIARLVYGYLVVFAETRKPDLGGVFFMTQLKQVQQGLFIYTALMTGVLLQRSATIAPGIIAGCAFLPLYYTYNQWKKYRWEFLEFADVKDYDAMIDKGEIPEVSNAHKGAPEALKPAYKQPELMLVAPPKEPRKPFFSGFGNRC